MTRLRLRLRLRLRRRAEQSGAGPELGPEGMAVADKWAGQFYCQANQQNLTNCSHIALILKYMLDLNFFRLANESLQKLEGA